MRNYGAASYSCTISAVAALQQVIARSRPFIGHIIRTGWFNERSDEFGELGASRASGCGPPAIAVQTKLFVSAVRDHFVDWSTDPPTIEPWDFADRVKNHIWEWEGY
jgi:hypothetical protein